jgi:uncharacterized protein (DUF1684 family)
MLCSLKLYAMQRFLLFSLAFVGFVGCSDKRYHHQKVQVSLDTVPKVLHKVYEWQNEKNASFKDGVLSPLRPKERKSFETLSFFEPDSTFMVIAAFEEVFDTEPFEMPTTANTSTKEVLYGRLYFELKGQSFSLEVYRAYESEDDYVFLPFRDDTNGVSTYGGGRYIDLRFPLSELVTIDFNKAYNPYCAYNPKYACAIVPAVNTLTVEVTAGEKKFPLKLK